MIKKAFKVVLVDDQIAQSSAELRKKYDLSMGDSMITATAASLKAICITDDPHFPSSRSKRFKPPGSKPIPDSGAIAPVFPEVISFSLKTRGGLQV